MRLLLLVLGLSVAACSIPTENFIGVPCGAVMCGEGSTCQNDGSAAVCVCAAGSQDNDHDNTCTPTCDGMACGSRMSCDDSSGTAACVCNAGFQDNDHDGACTTACSFADCGSGGTCSDSSGTATCACAIGYQDNDGDKKCRPSCDLAECGTFGCDDSDGEAVCVCSLTCGTNARCVARSGVAACECTGAHVDFDGDGDCTESCGPNLINGTKTGGIATIITAEATGTYSTNTYGFTGCSNRHDGGGILCDHAPSTNSTRAYTNLFPVSGVRFYSNGNTTGTGIVVIDAGSVIAFNSLELFQHFRRQNNTLTSPASHMRISVHASTTTAPSATDAGWVTLGSSFVALPASVQTGNVITKPGVWSGANQTSRYIRVEIQGANSNRTGIQAVKAFQCQ